MRYFSEEEFGFKRERGKFGKMKGNRGFGRSQRKGNFRRGRCFQQIKEEFQLTDEELEKLWLEKPRGVPFIEFIQEKLKERKIQQNEDKKEE